ncbi:hypothetical protein O0I10_004877 [Lichtheimia ornata]|uniref:Uncharacterized protein n=1 Tax=Lichtheimia ornata TaxID=688661 RepID=A0AAD7Y1Z6_9FUNG|nr:uncharacterized protein O0I10_004877 [Lichtheimia ornata]KAJ8659512.1 hypothetical protein O0I10_004877 [Lichtheimia ornata]
MEQLISLKKRAVIQHSWQQQMTYRLNPLATLNVPLLVTLVINVDLRMLDDLHCSTEDSNYYQGNDGDAAEDSTRDLLLVVGLALAIV